MPVPGSSGTSCRDRTAELFSIVERLRKAPSTAANGESSHAKPVEKPSASNALGVQSEFNKKASRIGLSIHQTSQKLTKLAKLAKRTSMFDDPAAEIQDLTAVIKQDITALNQTIAELQILCDARNNGVNKNKHTSEHSTTVVDSLKSRLMDTTKEFKDVLTMRTESLKVHENRRQLFSATGSSQPAPPSFGRTRSNSNSQQPPPWAAANGASSSSAASQLFTSSSAPRRQDTFGRPRQMMQQELVPAQDNYMASRAEALHNVEATIVELGNIFKDLSVMVQQQGEVAIRIDHDVDDTLANVEGAQGALLKYLGRISSNRWLIIKIFFVLIAFLLIFVFFVA
eukprot:jgi/Mesen1/6302/ME000325S05436